MGGCALLASSTFTPAADHAAQMRCASHGGCAVRAARCSSTRERSAGRPATNFRSTALVRPVALALPRIRAASTAACTVISGMLREYSTWCAPTASSARTASGTPEGRASSDSRAGARRRYQRSVPSVIACTGARSALPAEAARAASADIPLKTTASTARAAAASAGAPAAHGVLAKPTARERQTVRKITRTHEPPTRPLQLGEREEPRPALHDDGILTYGDDRSR